MNQLGCHLVLLSVRAGSVAAGLHHGSLTPVDGGVDAPDWQLPEKRTHRVKPVDRKKYDTFRCARSPVILRPHRSTVTFVCGTLALASKEFKWPMKLLRIACLPHAVC